MRKLYIVGLIALAVVIIGLAWAEQITLSTYYPAPYGVYKEFTTTSKTTLATNPSGTDANAKVGIGTADPQTILDLDVTSRIAAGGEASAFLPPRMTEAQRDAITNPLQGSVIYNISSGQEGLNHYDGNNWKTIGAGFGDRTYNDVGGSPFTIDTPYPATRDGFVVCWADYLQSHITGWADNNPNPMTRRCAMSCRTDRGIDYVSFTMPVKTGENWKITSTSGVSPIIYWVPLQ